MQDKSSLRVLLALDGEATVPMLIMGNFNTHSPMWLPSNVSCSHWAKHMEEWAATNLLTLANNPDVITQRGAAHERDLTIDLAWLNKAAIQVASFLELEIDWEGSLGSDHALLRIKGQAHRDSADPTDITPQGFVFDPGKGDEWITTFCEHEKPPPLPPLPTRDQLEAAAESLVNDINETNETTLHR